MVVYQTIGADPEFFPPGGGGGCVSTLYSVNF